jgi:hypothetical protein
MSFFNFWSKHKKFHAAFTLTGGALNILWNSLNDDNSQHDKDAGYNSILKTIKTILIGMACGLSVSFLVIILIAKLTSRKSHLDLKYQKLMKDIDDFSKDLSTLKDAIKVYKESLKNKSKFIKVECNDKLALKIKNLLKNIKKLPQDIPHKFKCPISQEIMSEPIKTADGHIFDRQAIKTWYQTLKNKGVKKPNCIFNCKKLLQDPANLPTDVKLQGKIIKYLSKFVNCNSQNYYHKNGFGIV